MLLKRRIEEASLNSWPALQQILFDGWILRFSEGYTKRANSVNPLFASSMDVGEKVDNGYFGLFDLITDPQRRNEGYGTLLVSSLLRWARQDEGSLHAYLQVVKSNTPARRLYARFGFREAYPYWYRVLTVEG